MTIVALILAAGASTRMGRSKPLLPWGGTNLLGWELTQLMDSCVDDGAEAEGVFADGEQFGEQAASEDDGVAGLALIGGLDDVRAGGAEFGDEGVDDVGAGRLVDVLDDDDLGCRAAGGGEGASTGGEGGGAAL